MLRYLYIIFQLLIFLCFTQKVEAQNIYLPNDPSCVINVKNAPYNAKGNGITDDTAAIQAAIYASISGNSSKVVYFPAGTYLISESIKLSLPNGVAPILGPWIKGESQYSSIIKILDNDSDFVTNNADEYIGMFDIPCENPFYFLTMHKSIENIGFELGNNPTACGIKACGQSNLIKNVRIKGKGVGAGIVLGHETTASNFLILQSSLRSLDVGIYGFNEESNYTISEVLQIDVATGLRLKNAMACIDNFVYLEGRLSGIEAQDSLTNFSIVNSTFDFNEEVLYNSNSNLFTFHNFYARNINLLNTPPIGATSPIYGVFDGDTSHIEEVYSAPVFKSQESDLSGMLRIPVKTAPRITYDTNLSNWVSVADFGANPNDDLSDSEAVQAAIDYATANNKTTVYFPGVNVNTDESYYILDGGYITVGGSVNHIIGLGNASIVGIGFIVDNAYSETVVFEHIYGRYNYIAFENFDIQRTMILEDCSGVTSASGNGNNFLNNYNGYLGISNSTSKNYGRGISTYLFDPSLTNEGLINIVNQGGTLWLSGVRTEQPNSVLASMNGGKSELLGGMVNPFYLDEDPPLFFTSEAQTTIANFQVRGLAKNGGVTQFAYDLEEGVNVGTMEATDATRKNSIVVYSDADEIECAPDGTPCEDGNPFTVNTSFQNCECVGQKVQLSLKVFLEGFYDINKGEMLTKLNQKRLIPNNQPFNVEPFNYVGTEKAIVISPFVSDWILVELRNKDNPDIIMYRKAAFLSLDGRLIDVSGYSDGTVFPGLPNGEYYVVVYHKSHLPIITQMPILIGSNATSFVDLTNEESLQGFAPVTELGGTDKKAMFAGDFDQNGLINNLDYNIWQIDNSLVNRYTPQDADGNGIVNNLDYNLWVKNRSKLAPELLHK